MAALTAREFNQYTGQAKKLAKKEPVFITERGSIEYVLLSIADYETLKSPGFGSFAKNPFEVKEDEYVAFDFDRNAWHSRGVDL